MGAFADLSMNNPTSFLLGDLRTDFTKGELSPNDLHDNPMRLFQAWLDEYMRTDAAEPTAMTLCTVGEQGAPSSRVVLLKGLDEGFCFFTNYLSQKGQQLAHNPQAALNFFWPELERQVSVQGAVDKLSQAESERYFHSRPKGSQLGAVVSKQSQPLVNREILDEALGALREQYAQADNIPLPEYWGGYRLTPTVISFWQGRANRLHDRFEYRKTSNLTPSLDANAVEKPIWEVQRLYP